MSGVSVARVSLNIDNIEKSIQQLDTFEKTIKSIYLTTGKRLSLEGNLKDAKKLAEQIKASMQEGYTSSKGTKDAIVLHEKLALILRRIEISQGQLASKTGIELINPEQLGITRKLKEELERVTKDSSYKEAIAERAKAEKELGQLQKAVAEAGGEKALENTNRRHKYNLDRKKELEEEIALLIKKQKIENTPEVTKTLANKQKDLTGAKDRIQRDAPDAELFNQLKTDGPKLEAIIQQLTLNVDAFFITIREAVAQHLNVGIDEIGTSFDKIGDKIGELKEKQGAAAKETYEGLGPALEEISGEVQKSADVVDKSTEAFVGNEKAQVSLQQTQAKVASFFKLASVFNMLKRAVRQSFTVIKELDKAMTQTAVVTKFTVQNMWEQLDKYTKKANELGTTTVGAYETMTLFYQQGLQTNEVFAVGTETMKMARIAGLEYKEATDLMTAALRGFNMEINEVSAKRVNDVYSELAAVSAASGQEIAYAMTKAAAIANSAKMTFEVTSALLTKGIETTREPAENIGTALKTITARFAELKKDPLTLSEVDGEVIDANRIEKALRTVDIALRGTDGQFRSLDDVLLEISAKWDTMSNNHQRYVATMAAGSRQQSRFIAMMSDNARLTELLGHAMDSSGASSRQFEKTMDSLDSKLNMLKNAWNEFVMGITDSGMIKEAVDLGTKILSMINKLTKGSTTLNGTILKLGVAIVGLKFGGKIADAVFKKLLTNFTKGVEGAGVLETAFNKVFHRKTFDPEQIKDLQNRRKELIATGEATTQVDQQLKTLQGTTGGLTGALKSAAIAGAAMVAVLAITALIGVITKRVKFLKEANARMLKTVEALDNQLENTKDKIEDLANTKSRLAELTSEFDKLVEGTEAWNKALQENNDLILAMLEKYPDLADHIQFKNGKMTIDAGGLDSVIQQQQELVKSIIAAKVGVGTQIANRQGTPLAQSFGENIDLGILNKMLKGAVDMGLAYSVIPLAELITGKDYSGGTRDLGEASFLGAVEQNGLKINNPEDWTQIEEIYMIGRKDSEETRETFRQGLTALNNQLTREEKARSDAAKQVQVYLKNFVSESFKDSEYTDTLVNMVDQQKDEYDKLVKQIATQDKRTNEALVNEYARLTGQKKSEVKADIDAKDLDYNNIRWALAGEAAVAELEKGIAKSNDALQKWSKSLLKEDFEKLLTVLSKEGKEMDLSTIRDFGKKLEEPFAKITSMSGFVEIAEEYQKTNQLSDEEMKNFTREDAQLFEMKKALADIYKVGVEEITDEMGLAALANIKIVTEAKAKMDVLNAQFGFDKFDEFVESIENSLGKELSFEEIEGLSKSLQGIVIRGGNIAKFQGGLSEFIKTVPKKMQSEVTQMLTTTDWGDAGQVDALINSLRIMGVELKETFITKMKEATKSVREFSVEALDSLIKRAQSTRKMLRGKMDAGEVVFNEGEIDPLKDIGIPIEQYFVVTDEGEWVLIKGTVAELATLVEEYTRVRQQETRDDLEEKIAKGEKIGALMEEDEEIQKAFELVTNYTGKEPRGFLGIEGSNRDAAVAKQTDFLVKKLKLDIDTTDLAPEVVRAIIKEEFDFYGKDGTALQKAREELEQADAKINPYDGLRTGKEVMEFDIGANYDDEEERNKCLEQRNRILTALIVQDKEASKIWEKQKYLIKDSNSAFYQQEDLLKAAILTELEYGRKMDDLNEFLKENADLIENRGINEELYGIQLGALGELAREVFGELATDEWVNDHIDNLALMASGQEGAAEIYEELIASLVESSTYVIDNFGSDAMYIQDILDDMNGQEIGIGGWADFTPIYNQLLKLAGSAEKVDELLKAMNYMVSVDPLNNTVAIRKIGSANLRNVRDYSGTKPAYRAPKKGGGGNKKEDWKNDYDWLYNLTEAINGKMREREKIERQYNRLLKGRKATGQELLEQTKKEAEAILSQNQLQRNMLSRRNAEMDKLQGDNPDLQKYATYNAASQTIEIDWDQINKIKDPDKGKVVQEYISGLEKLSGEIKDAEDEIENGNDILEEIKERGKQAALDFEQQVLDAVVHKYQTEIDELQNINDSINTTNEKLMASIQKNLEKIRQDRQNEKTEEEISDKRRRLAFLQQDTSGANQMEILALQKEIDESEESYTDTLIDQKINELQEQNDLAAEQREKQIELAQARLNHDTEEGEFWTEVEGLMADGISATGALLKDSELVTLLEAKANFAGMSEMGKDDWFNTEDILAGQAWAYLKGQTFWESDDFTTLATSVNNQANANTDRIVGAIPPPATITVNVSGGGGAGSGGYVPTFIPQPPPQDPLDKKYNDLTAAQQREALAVITSSGLTSSQIDALIQNFKGNQYTLKGLASEITRYRGKPTKSVPVAVATGGYTGDWAGDEGKIAMLHKKELIFNQQDSKNMIMLKDLLSKAFKTNFAAPESQKEKRGDTHVEVNIEVAEIANDYDVEKLADKIRKEITRDALHRNFNAVRL